MSFFNTFFNIVIGSDRYQHRQLSSFLYLIIMMAEILAQEILIMIMIKFRIMIITNYSLFLIACPGHLGHNGATSWPPPLPVGWLLHQEIVLPSDYNDHCWRWRYVTLNDSSRYFHDDNDDMIIINNCSGIEVDWHKTPITFRTSRGSQASSNLYGAPRMELTRLQNLLTWPIITQSQNHQTRLHPPIVIKVSYAGKKCVQNPLGDDDDES